MKTTNTIPFAPPARKRAAFPLAFVLLASALCSAQTHFDHAEFLKAAAPGQKKGAAVKGTLHFDGPKKAVLFLDKKGDPAFDIKYDSIKSLLYERTSKPRYAEGLLIAWPLLFTKSKKHYLTIQYEEPAGTGHFAIQIGRAHV